MVNGLINNPWDALFICDDRLVDKFRKEMDILTLSEAKDAT